MSNFVLDPTWAGEVGSLADEADPREVVESRQLTTGRVWDVRRDTVDLGDGQVVVRDFVVHTGAVAVLALDDRDRVFLLRQYRHPVAASLWEIVAGLLDVADEDPWTGAARELVEEAGLVASEWHTLVDIENSPGGSSETLRCYLARGLSAAPGGRPDGHGEERDLPFTWVPLDEVVRLILDGRLSSPSTVVAVLAAAAARAEGWSTLRAVEAAWPARDRVVTAGRARVYGPSSPAGTD
jgi:ADP-ribose pyrophosphatase